jgi:hypothetical protein
MGRGEVNRPCAAPALRGMGRLKQSKEDAYYIYLKINDFTDDSPSLGASI